MPVHLIIQQSRCIPETRSDIEILIQIFSWKNRAMCGSIVPTMTIVPVDSIRPFHSKVQGPQSNTNTAAVLW